MVFELRFDERMVFPKEMYDGASKFSVSLDSVWRPEVMLLNNADRTYEPTFPSNVLITPEGISHLFVYIFSVSFGWYRTKLTVHGFSWKIIRDHGFPMNVLKETREIMRESWNIQESWIFMQGFSHDTSMKFQIL